MKRPWIFLWLIASASLAQNRGDYQLAESFFQAQNYEQAAERFQKLYEQNPTSQLYFDRLRVSLYESRQYDKAIALISKELDRKENREAMLLTLMQCHFAKGDGKRGDEALRELLARAQDVPQFAAIVVALKKERALDRVPKAVLEARQKLRGLIERADALFAEDLADAYLFLNRYADATREYLKTLDADAPDFQRARAQISSYAQKSSPDALRQTIKTMEEEKSKYRDLPRELISQLLMSLYMEAGEFDRAYDEALWRDRTMDAGGGQLIAFAQMALAQNALPAARKAFQAAIALDGSVHAIQMGKLGLARVWEAEARQASANSREKAAEAIAAFKDYANKYRQSPEAPEALLSAADLQFRSLGAPSDAKATLERLFETFPESPTFRRAELLMAQILLEQDCLDDARKTLNAMLARPFLSPRLKADATLLLGQLAYYETNFDEALKRFSEIETPREASNDALLQRLTILKGMGDTLKNPNARQALARFALIEKQIAQRKNAVALESLKQWISDFGNSILADDALFKKAELEETLAPARAIETYERLSTNYPKSFHADKALFQLGKLSEQILKNREKAIACYETLIKQYPRSFWVKAAREELRRLKQPG
ncbi:MAG: tetratricopeptide repeat protein [Chloroherpetonaceae bacterium]|nr:tetratricopeptide repeat protein [Chloroherpetonaceae bacterium]MDW8437518.1 tetratricopeptide repeat protein [Chloroherpetonaceae bacterium]